MTAKEMWQVFSDYQNISHSIYSAWQFGDTPDELADLVLMGIKTSSSSAFELYQFVDTRISEKGDYHIVLNSKNEAVCIIQTTKVSILPFHQIGEKEALAEGDGSLKNWSNIHVRYFTEELRKHDLDFRYDMLLVYEEFKRVYPL